MELTYPDRPHSDRERADLVFRGGLAIYRQVAALRPLLALATQHLTAAFGGIDPRFAHKKIAPADYDNRMGEVRATWRRNDDVRTGWTMVFDDIGLNPADTCYDWFYIRALPPGDSHLGHHSRCLPPHRDTWGSNVYQQINWWTPIFPISSENAFVIYPDYWRRAVTNTSADWDLTALRRLPRAQRKDYPNLPDILETPANPMPIVLEPGDIVAFSGQHLHASQYNPVADARFNLECRTVCVSDVTSERAAPNTDGAAPHTAWDWFKRLSDTTPLPDLLSAQAD